MKRASKTTRALRRAYDLMYSAHGHQHWWPGDTPFEICVGAILTQNTAWTNVEKAIANLKRAKAISVRRIHELPHAELAELIRPAGYFNIKADRLKCFVQVLVKDHNSSLKKLFNGQTPAIRERLLNIKGIGPETADSMLLYAGDHHSFVIDAYTKRIFQRHHWWKGEGDQGKAKAHNASEYDSLQRLCENSLTHKPEDQLLDYWQDYHAQIVVVGKDYCKTRNPDCEHCPLKEFLPNRKTQAGRLIPTIPALHPNSKTT
ncbi:MAG: endonuclease [Verrucomicrobiales bacterium]|nr:endonuclease [Verrucomicrobiales bacterium]|tara:strand:- start:3285 stop:4064 length:780 start_codon:yes stop_codon:yes gene_type:complete